jgi:hypothetical protein
MSRLPAEIFLAINVVVFVGAGYYLPTFTWARSVTASSQLQQVELFRIAVP